MGYKDPEFMVVSEVSELMRCSIGTAYKVMQQINKERKAEGLIVIRGRVPKAALLKRIGLA